MSIALASRPRRTIWRARHRQRPLKAAVHGICHATALRKMLDQHPSCAGNIEFIPMKKSFRMTEADIEQFEREIAPQLDVFIFQPDRGVARPDRFSSFSMVQHLRPDCLWVTFPILHFSVYAPFFHYPLPELGEIPFDYFDFAIVAQFLEGIPSDQAAKRIAEIELSDEWIERTVDSVLGRVEAREHGEMGQVDVLVSPFLRENLRKEKLFHTIDHPGLTVMSHLAEGVLDRLHTLGALDNKYAGEPFEDQLDQIHLPVHPSIQRAFGLEEDSRIIFTEGAVSEQVVIDRTYEFLAAADRELIEESLRQQQQVRPWFSVLGENRG